MFDGSASTAVLKYGGGRPRSGRALQLHDAHRVRQHGRWPLAVEGRQLIERAVQTSEIDERQRGQESCLARQRRVLRHTAGNRQRLLRLSLVGVDAPERRQQPRIARGLLQRRLEELLLTGGRRRHESLDVILEDRQCHLRIGVRVHAPSASRRAGQDRRRASEQHEDVRERRRLNDIGHRRSGFEAQHSRAHVEVGPETEIPEDDLRRADHLADADHRRVRQRRRHRQLQTIEGDDALVARHDGHARLLQPVDQQDASRLAQPHARAGPSRRVGLHLNGKRHDQNATGGGTLGVRRTGEREGGGNRGEGRSPETFEHLHQKTSATRRWPGRARPGRQTSRG